MTSKNILPPQNHTNLRKQNKLTKVGEIKLRGKAGGNDYANCNPNIVRLKPWWWAKIFDNSSDCCNPNIVRLKLKASENIVIVRKCCNPN
ncbi:MAG: hypothetical protein ACP5I9_09625, partial [Candidatus Kapaibacteriota bacterium]